MEPPEVDLSGTSFVVLWRGDAGAAAARGWIAAIERAGRPVSVCDDVAGAHWPPPAFVAALAAARVGTRVMVAAPQLEVLDALRAARAAGAIDAELRALVTDAPERRVRCPHCRGDTVTRAGTGETVDCGGCGQVLRVGGHLSRHHGAYLGALAGVEDPA